MLPNKVYATINQTTITAANKYNWRYKHPPYLNASFYRTSNQNGEVVFVDLATLQHHFNTEEEDPEKIIESNPPEFEQLIKEPWRLLILEDEILEKCGAGVYPPELCDTTMEYPTNGKRRKRSTNMWEFLNYSPVRAIRYDFKIDRAVIFLIDSLSNQN